MQFRKIARGESPKSRMLTYVPVNNHGDLFIAHVRFERLGVHMPNPKLPQGVLQAEGRGL